MPSLRDYQRWARRRKPRKRMQGSATARGYGYDHVKIRAALIAAWQPGQPCTRCGQPMWHLWTTGRSGRRMAAIHLGHNDDKTAYRGLEHAHCNLSDGATRGNQMRAPVRRRPSRVW